MMLIHRLGGGFSNSPIVDEVVHGFGEQSCHPHMIEEVPDFKAFRVCIFEVELTD